MFGATLSCVTPIVCIAALLSVQSPFVAPLEKYALSPVCIRATFAYSCSFVLRCRRDAANEARMKFAVGKSDHLTLLK
jgi:hypothetical protein